MFELIGSEASYLRSLGVAVSHFYTSEALKQTLSTMQHHILFSNIRHVTAASQQFLVDLEARLGENVLISQVGDVVLQHCRRFHSLYVPYVTNMMYQEENRNFLCSLKKLESDPVCQRQSLKSFLVLPFQRITRIKLLLERFIVVDHAEFPKHVTVEHLKTEVLALPPESFLLHLAQSQTGHPTAMILVAHTR
uniref:DH domain-containing protein n=1 Tax=Stegastes partitus TaxID=144197 RepID=A0A3B4ZMW7_9TELE